MNSKQHNIVWTVILLMGLGLFGWSFYGNETTTHSNPGVASHATSTADVEHVDDGIGLIPIEQIKVGMRVPARNPEVTDAERAKFVDPDPATWRYLKLELPKQSGGILDIEMIRSLDWIEENDASVGNQVYLEMKELGAVGNAKVLEIDDCPPIQGGPGEVVISTFAHPASHTILNLIISESDNSEGETIGVTETHPFWSVNHQAFVPAGQLQVGDQVLTRDGQTKRITSLLPRPGPPERVFNVEVNGEHVYYVGNLDLLVHNACPDEAWRSLNPDDIERILNNKSVISRGTRGGNRAKVDLVASSATDTKFISVTESFVVVERYGDVNNYIKFNPKKLHTGTYLSYSDLLKDKQFMRGLGSRQNWLDQQVHGIVVGEIPWEAIEEIVILGQKIK